MQTIDPFSIRDRSRRPGAKLHAMSRKAQRVAKSALLFSVYAFADASDVRSFDGEG